MTTANTSAYQSYRNLPTLAGLATLADAARPGRSEALLLALGRALLIRFADACDRS
jgi:hypothetical protein